MDFWATILVLLRRWYIAVPAFVLTFAAVGVVYVSRPIEYTSSSVLVLTVPASGATQRVDSNQPIGLSNPLLNFDQGLSNAAVILVQALSTPEAAAQLGVRPGGDPTIQITNGSNNPELLINGPFIVITGQSRSPGEAQDLVTRMVQRAGQELVNRQHELKAPRSTYIVLFEAVPPTTPQPERSTTRLRPAISILALGSIASVASAFGVESIMTRPGRRRRDHSAADRRATVGTVADFEGNGAAQTGPSARVAAQLSSGDAVPDDERQV